MSKAKPFLFGTALGASAMFVALQYHVVHTGDGFQVLPRTPQQSLGLAYADIRGWSPSQWTDRPELARALMAHGSSDLITESVANSLADAVSEESSTLDDLRTFLNSSAEKARASEVDAEESLGRPVDEQTDRSGANELFRIPFPQDARTQPVLEDPFKKPSAPPALTGEEKMANSAGSRFSADDVRTGLGETSGERQRLTSSEPPARTDRTGGRTTTSQKAAESGTASQSARSAAELADEMDQRIFGGTTDKRPAARKPPAEPEDDGAAMFEEVTSQLERRATEALNRARAAVVEKAVTTVEEARPGVESFMRSQTAATPAESTRGSLPELVPGAVKEAVKDAAKSTTEAPAGLKGFDPFLE